MASTDKEDERLMRLVADGDRAAFAASHRRVYAQVYRFALRMVQAPDRAEEVANDTMVAVWSGAARFEFRSKVSTWIFGVAYRIALRTLKRNRFERRLMDIDDMPELEDANAAAPEAFLDKRRVARALSTLPADLKAVVELTYFYGFSYPEIGEILSCPVGTVKSRMHAARARLREVLQ